MNEPVKDERLIKAPDGFEPHIARWVWGLEDTRWRTKESLAGLSTAALDWLPPEGDNSIGTILYHIVAVELSYLYEDMLEIEWSKELDPLLIYDVRDSQGRLTAVRGESLAQHLNRLDEGRTLLLRALGQMSLEEFRRPRQVGDYIISPEWAAHLLIQHEAEHRGQIGDLRRRAELAGAGR